MTTPSSPAGGSGGAAPALRFAVIGAPVAHSRSPAMHGAAFLALGLPHAYERLETSEAELPARVAALRSGTFAGLNVTVPHKTRALALADEVDPSATGAGAANTLVRTPSGRVRAYNTDVAALAAEIVALASPDATAPARATASLRGGHALVLGAGGAARAALVALAGLGVARITLRARAFDDPSRTARSAELLAAMTQVLAGAAGPAAPWLVTEGLSAAPIGDLAVVVQTSTCGMLGGPPGAIVRDAVEWGAVPAPALAYDVVYAPETTPFLEAARARGLRSASGLGMLVRQGALAFELWLGVAPPLDVMAAAVRSSSAA